MLGQLKKNEGEEERVITLNNKVNRFQVQNNKDLSIQLNKITPNCVAYLGEYLCVGSAGGVITIYQLDTKWNTFQEKRCLEGHKDEITCLGLKGGREGGDYGGQQLVSGGKDGMMIVWDLEEEDNDLVFQGHSSALSCLCPLNDHHTILTGGLDRQLVLWDTLRKVQVKKFPLNASIYQITLF